MNIKSQKDFFAGLMFMGVGTAFAWGATTYSIGTGARMGPGYFPLILGILLAIAIPAYSDYTIRAKISEGINLAAAAKMAVAETRQSSSDWPTDNATAGIADTITSSFVESVVVSDPGVITVLYQNIDTAVDVPPQTTRARLRGERAAAERCGGQCGGHADDTALGEEIGERAATVQRDRARGLAAAQCGELRVGHARERVAPRRRQARRIGGLRLLQRMPRVARGPRGHGSEQEQQSRQRQRPRQRLGPRASEGLHRAIPSRKLPPHHPGEPRAPSAPRAVAVRRGPRGRAASG